jgi:hypothetical protein
MSEFKGTPGPWRDMEGDERMIVIAQSGRIVAGLEPAPISGVDRYDAALIAAAPALLDALQTMPGLPASRVMDSWWENVASRAIAKALGVGVSI